MHVNEMERHATVDAPNMKAKTARPSLRAPVHAVLGALVRDRVEIVVVDHRDREADDEGRLGVEGVQHLVVLLEVARIDLVRAVDVLRTDLVADGAVHGGVVAGRCLPSGGGSRVCTRRWQEGEQIQPRARVSGSVVDATSEIDPSSQLPRLQTCTRADSTDFTLFDLLPLS